MRRSRIARPRRVALVTGLALVTTLQAGSPSTHAHEVIPPITHGVVLPAGFGLSTFGETPGLLPTSLTFGPDGRLYVAAIQGVTVANGFQFIASGGILAFDDLGGVGGPPAEVAGGMDQVLGITFGPDGTLYAADNAANKGRIQALRDADGDGVYEQRRTVVENIPNGRHQTNGMTFGPDGMLYVANGSATDDGLECGPEPVISLACPTPEVRPWTGAILRVDPAWTGVDLLADVTVDADPFVSPDGLDDESVLVARGFRNIYDVDFRPGDPSMLYTPMNGSDDPASNEPLYRTGVADSSVVGTDGQGNPVLGPVIDDAGFPSCLYGPHENPFPVPEIGGHEHPEDFTPEDSPNEAVTNQFGLCPKDDVIRPIMFFEGAHNGTTGLAFERGDEFPERYDGDLFVGEWGSIWNLNGGDPTGHKITHIDIGPGGLVERRREFMTGGVPMDVTFGPDGAMYVADFQGLIYRIVHVFDTADTATVEIHNGQFIPQVVFIPKATRVLWVNLDSAPHNVRARQAVVIGNTDTDPPLQSGSEIDSPGDIAPAGSHSHAFGEHAGVWVYRSTTTPAEETTMPGAVVVLPVDR